MAEGRDREGGQLRRMEYTLFVNNLPSNVDRFDLGNLFREFGEIIDIYIPNKFGRNSQKRVGFVRFRLENHGRVARRNLDGFFFRNSRLSVSWARFPEMRKRRIGREFNPGRRQSTPVKGRYGPNRRRPASNLYRLARPPCDSRRPTPENWVWRPKKVQTWAMNSGPSPTPQVSAPKKSIKEVHGSVCVEALEWLENSIVCISANPMDPDILASHITS